MYIGTVNKIVASYGERTTMESSTDELLMHGSEDFQDRDVLAVKFIVDEDEESSWYINPIFVGGCILPSMSSEFLPELVLIHFEEISQEDLLDYYWKFHYQISRIDSPELTDEDKYHLFVEWMQNKSYEDA